MTKTALIDRSTTMGQGLRLESRGLRSNSPHLPLINHSLTAHPPLTKCSLTAQGEHFALSLHLHKAGPTKVLRQFAPLALIRSEHFAGVTPKPQVSSLKPQASGLRSQAYDLRSNASGSSASGSVMRRTRSPERRWSMTVPTTSARQPWAKAGSSPSSKPPRLRR
jgi:hypothetical protein